MPTRSKPSSQAFCLVRNSRNFIRSSYSRMTLAEPEEAPKCLIVAQELARADLASWPNGRADQTNKNTNADNSEMLVGMRFGKGGNHVQLDNSHHRYRRRRLRHRLNCRSRQADGPGRIREI